MSKQDLLPWFNHLVPPTSSVTTATGINSMDLAQLALILTCSSDTSLYAAQLKYFCFGVADGSRGATASHKANLRGVILLLNDHRLLVGENLPTLAQGVCGDDRNVAEATLLSLLKVIKGAWTMVRSMGDWQKTRRKLEERELSNGNMFFPTNPITEETVTSWPSGWDDIASEMGVSRGEIQELATQARIIRDLEQSLNMVARYVPLLGLQSEDYSRVYHQQADGDRSGGGGGTDEVLALCSSEAERAWMAGAASVYYTQQTPDGPRVIPQVEKAAAALPSTPQTAGAPSSRNPPLAGGKRVRSPAPPVVANRGGLPLSSSTRRPPPPQAPVTPSARSSTHTDDGTVTPNTTSAAAHQQQHTKTAYIQRCEAQIQEQCTKGVTDLDTDGCVVRHVGRFPSELSPTAIERDLVWACIVQAVSGGSSSSSSSGTQ